MSQRSEFHTPRELSQLEVKMMRLRYLDFRVQLVHFPLVAAGRSVGLGSRSQSRNWKTGALSRLELCSTAVAIKGRFGRGDRAAAKLDGWMGIQYSRGVHPTGIPLGSHYPSGIPLPSGNGVVGSHVGLLLRVSGSHDCRPRRLET